MKHRRRLYIAGGVLLTLAVLSALVWFVWLPGWRPDRDAGERYGIDVSAHQGSIDWKRVSKDGIDFAYLKATEGRDFSDKHFGSNWQEASEAGLQRGAYHYFTLCSTGSDQARHFLEVAPPEPSALPPAVDLEALTGSCNPTRATVEREIHEFLALVERSWGRGAVLYVSGDFEDRFPIRDEPDRARWQPHLLLRPGDSRWVMWQASSFAHIDGISGSVDLDVRSVRWRDDGLRHDHAISG